VVFGATTLTSQGAQDGFIARLSADTGAAVWSARYGTAAGWESVTAVKVDGMGEVFAAMSEDGMMKVIKLRQGQETWKRTLAPLGGLGSDGISQIAVDSAGDFVVVGSSQGSLDLGGGPLAGGSGALNAEIFVAKYSGSTGGHVWSRRLQGDGSDFAWDVLFDRNDDVIFTGSYGYTAADKIKPFVMRLSGDSGAPLWQDVFDIAVTASFTSGGAALALDPSDNIILYGHADKYIRLSTQQVNGASSGFIFLASYSSAGQISWSTGWPSLYPQSRGSITVAQAGEVIVSGRFNTRLSLPSAAGAFELSTSGWDAFVFKYRH
jgi:hypothetical protein